MQEEIEQKSFNLMISTTKLSARTVLNAVKAAIRLYQSKASQGKQSVRTLLRQNRGVSSVEISKTGIKGFERYAKKYGIDYAIRKDSSEVPPKYLVFFKAPDAEAFQSAFKEYSASLLSKSKRPSVLAKLHTEHRKAVSIMRFMVKVLLLPLVLVSAFLALMLRWTLNLSAFILALPMMYIFGCGLYTLYCREWTQFLILLAAEFGCFLLITAGTVIVEAVEWFSGWIAEL